MSDPHPARHEPVYSVHTAKPDGVGAIEIIFRTEREARSFARDPIPRLPRPIRLVT